jgi:hypothetical protein
MEAIGVLRSQIVFDSANGEIHLRELPGSGIRFLSKDADVADTSAVRFDKFLALHEHAARPTAGIEDAAFVRSQHLDQELNDATRGVELSALLSFGAGELAKEVLIDPT